MIEDWRLRLRAKDLLLAAKTFLQRFLPSGAARLRCCFFGHKAGLLDDPSQDPYDTRHKKMAPACVAPEPFSQSPTRAMQN
jgi:hypothetical protein